MRCSVGVRWGRGRGAVEERHSAAERCGWECGWNLAPWVQLHCKPDYKLAVHGVRVHPVHNLKLGTCTG